MVDFVNLSQEDFIQIPVSDILFGILSSNSLTVGQHIAYNSRCMRRLSAQVSPTNGLWVICGHGCKSFDKLLWRIHDS